VLNDISNWHTVGLYWVPAGLNWVPAGLYWVPAGLYWVPAGLYWVPAGLYWVPGHAGVRGNEITDKLTRDGSVQMKLPTSLQGKVLFR